jgi:hypothetical protein
MGTSRLTDRERTRRAGELGMWLIVAELLIAMALIWEVERLWGGVYVDDDHVFATFWWLLLTGVPAMVCVYLAGTKDSRLAGSVGIGVMGVAFVGLMIGTFLPGQTTYSWGISTMQGKWVISGIAIGLIGLLAVGSLVGAPSPMQKPWRWGSVVTCAAAAVLVLADIWQDLPDRFLKATVCLLSVGVITTHANVVLLVPLRDRHRWLAYATVSVAVFTFVMIDLQVISGSVVGDFTEQLVEPLAAAGGIVTIFGTVAVAVLSRLARPVAIEHSSEQIRHITVVCPICRKKQTVSVGQTTRCRACYLCIEVRLAEPRCSNCDHLLYYTDAKACPECGRVI